MKLIYLSFFCYTFYCFFYYTFYCFFYYTFYCFSYYTFYCFFSYWNRDIKGGNVLIDTDTVKLADFGASTKMAFGETQSTSTIKGEKENEWLTYVCSLFFSLSLFYLSFYFFLYLSLLVSLFLPLSSLSTSLYLSIYLSFFSLSLSLSLPLSAFISLSFSLSLLFYSCIIYLFSLKFDHFFAFRNSIFSAAFPSNCDFCWILCITAFYVIYILKSLNLDFNKFSLLSIFYQAYHYQFYFTSLFFVYLFIYFLLLFFLFIFLFLIFFSLFFFLSFF